MNEFRFAYPLVLPLVLFPLVFHFSPVLRHYLAASGTMRFSDIRLIQDLPTSWRAKARSLPDIMRYVAFVLLVLSLSRPQTGHGREIIRGQGTDIVITLDISTSMAALDFEPQNRLEAAKAVISDFIAGRQFDRIGLVVFARNAYYQAPLTLDYPILLQLLNDVQLVSQLRQTEGRGLDGTAIGLGLATSVNMLRDSSSPSKTIILLTDGANNVGLDPLLAAEAAAAFDINLYTIGMGKPGLVNIPDQQGNMTTIESDLDENSLRDIAAIGNGLYFRAEDTAGLHQIYDQIDALERSEAERYMFVRWRDWAVIPLIGALGFLLGEVLLRHTIFQSLP